MGQTLRRTWSLTGVLAVTALSSALMTTPATAAETDTPGPTTPRIVGGEPASIAQYPYVAYLADSQGFQFCGATIAKADKIVTAAHCVKDQPPGGIQVVAGREDKTSNAGTVAKVTDIWVHPEFKSAEMGSDVAVLTLDQELPQPPLELASHEDSALYQPGTATTVLGWGATSEGGEDSATLRQAHPPVVSDEECAAAYPGQFSPESMVCAGVPEGGVDSCQGDSGGPLVAGDKLIGIVSWGTGCARPHMPGVYTRVSTYYEDIQDQLESHLDSHLDS